MQRPETLVGSAPGPVVPWPVLGAALLAMAGVLHGAPIASALLVSAAAAFVWVHALHRALGDVFDAVLALVVLVCLLSFVGPDVAVREALAIGTALVAIVAIPAWRSSRETPEDAGMTGGDAAWWVALLALALLLGHEDGGGWRTIDPHAVYEASVGRAYERAAPVDATDLSYAGKPLRYHFFTTRVPHFFARVFGIDPLAAVSVVAPFFFALLAVPLLGAFFARHPAVRAPAAFVFLLPFCAFGAGGETLLQRTLLMTTSFWVGFLLVLIALEHLIAGRHGRVALAAGLLLVSKASFFLTLAGGVALLALVRRQRALFALTGVLAVVFVVGFKAFLSGAHAHNAWILFPSYLWAFLAWNGGLTGLATIALAAFYFVIAARALAKHREDPVLAPLAAVGVSGLMGPALLTEVTEGNHLQFLIAAYLPLALLTWRWLVCSRTERPRLFVVAAAAAAVLVLASTAALKQRFVDHLAGKAGVAYERHLIDAYAWLARAPRGVVVFGNHHEWHAAKSWPPPSNFVRSALSGQPFLCEDYMAKGVMLEPELPARLAGSLHLHRAFVRTSQESERALRAVTEQASGAPPAPPLSQSPRASHRLVHRLSGREWCALNMPRRVETMLGVELAALAAKPADVWLDGFLAAHSVRYIVLEAGDRPSPELARRVDEVYSNPRVTVLAVRR